MNIKNLMITFIQLLSLLGFWFVGGLIQKTLHLPISAGILGMFLLLFCLFFKILRIEHVEVGANAALRELVLFFLPIIVAVVQYKSLFINEGWQLAICIIAGTALVMLSTSLTIHFIYRLKDRKNNKALEAIK
ncbi:CidA/LrgA family protein [Acinetobacter nectaris]|uniref:CidA/LrgA family protein n=1 Tax=Acinetobacter nectaris TaxID=1219382 RepID=UPI001F0069C8|nr:CidA/LrgA family protein [Acinetobacter nectaris]MCF9000071.1 CidA/LrgA family protein [Acinetobacter nectaris]MCF9027025.1 CidA/LrgA family protein [Acinetobacter nectaris]